jgi:hypothetical protein
LLFDDDESADLSFEVETPLCFLLDWAAADVVEALPGDGLLFLFEELPDVLLDSLVREFSPAAVRDLLSLM